MYIEYTESPATVERLTTSAPVGFVRVQESNIDLTTGGSFNTPCAATSESPVTIASPTDQHPPSESPTLIPRDQSSFRLVQRHGDDCTTKQHSKPTFGRSIPFKCGNWKTGLEVGMLSGIIIIIWVLFSIPAILYALPPKIREVYLQKLPLPFRLIYVCLREFFQLGPSKSISSFSSPLSSKLMRAGGGNGRQYV